MTSRMNSTSNGDIFVRVQPAPTWHTSYDGNALTIEPHHLLLIFAGTQVRITDCRCENCQPILAVARVAPSDLARFFQKQGVGRAIFLPHRDLWLPLPDGTQSSSLGAVMAFAQSMADAGLHVRLVEAQATEVGTWVRTKKFDWVDLDNVVVPGLLGQVAPDPYGMCTPGISTQVLLVGRHASYGHLDDILEILEVPPTAEEIAQSEALCARALEAFEAEHGWSGYVRIGNERPRREDEVRAELAGNLNRLTGPRVLPEGEQRGILKRIRRVLVALGDRSGSTAATALAERVGRVVGDDLPGELIADLRSFAERSLRPE